MDFKLKIIIEILKLIFKPKFKSRAALEKYQKKKIEKQLNFLKKHTEYFKDKTSIEINDFPIINKSIMMNNFDQLNTANIKKTEAISIAIEAEKTRDFTPQINGITIGLSSGTSGNKSIFLASEKDRIKYIGAIFNKVLLPLSHINTRVALFFRANSNLYESIGSILIEFNYFDFTGDLKLQIEELNKLNPHILVAPPTLLNTLATKQEDGVLNINPDKIISVAEVLEDDIRTNIENTFSQTVHQLYQCTEGFLASTCKYGNLHLHEDYIYFEKKWLDKEKTKFHPIITDFTRTTQAMIRYELNDILHIGNNCKCGSVYTNIKKIEGRSDDIFKFNNGTEIIIFPDEIRNTIIIASDKVLDYQVIQLDNTTVSISLKFKDDNKSNEIRKVIFNALEILFKSKGIYKLNIIESQWKTPETTIKFRRIINKNN